MSSLFAKKQQSNKHLRKKNVLQTHEYSLAKKGVVKICKRKRNEGDIACPLFWERGSLTVEAALILPLFLSVVMTILSFLNVMEIAIEHRIQQQNLMKTSAVTAHLFPGTEIGREGDCIRVDLLYPVSLPIKGFGYKQILIRQKSLIHIFNGYDDSCGDRMEKKEEYVYITDSGGVYHRKRSCQALNVSVKEVNGDSVLFLRNAEKKKYYGCTICGNGYSREDLQTGSLYVTDYGIKYHVSLSCPELQRTVQVIKISHARGRKPCRFCGESGNS